MPDNTKDSRPSFEAAVEAEIARRAERSAAADKKAQEQTDTLREKLLAASDSEGRTEVLLLAYFELIRSEEAGKLRDEDMKSRMVKCEEKTQMLDVVVDAYQGISEGLGSVEEGQLSESAEGKVQKITKASAAKWGGGIGGVVIAGAELLKWLMV